MKSYTVDQIKQIAQDLLSPGEDSSAFGNEYNRGICELIADLDDSIPDGEHDLRSQEIAKEFGVRID